MEIRVQIMKASSFDFDDFEPKLKERVSKELGKTDFLHTLKVVENMKRYISMEGGKRDMLLSAAYLHEVGKGENTVLLSNELADMSPVLRRCALVSQKAKQLLLALNFPPEKAEEVARYLAKNESIELKRAHHNMY